MSWEMLVFIALWLPAASATGLKTTCLAPPARRGGTGTVTCIFPVPLASVSPVTATLMYYLPNSNKLDKVLEIILAKKGAQPDIRIYIDGYKLNNDVDELGKEISVQIPRISEEHLGHYMCHMKSNNLQETVHPEPCTLRLKNEGGLKTTCFAPPTRRGALGTVTCIFPMTLASVSPVTAIMKHYLPNSSKLDYVLRVILSKKGAQPDIKIYIDGYKLNRDFDVLGKVISVQITRVSEEHLGQYMCQLMSTHLQDTVQPKTCTLRLKNERGLKSTCHAADARRGEAGTVTCIFPVTLASVPPVLVSMEHYPPDSSIGLPDDVLEIVLAEKGARPDINIYIDGYKLNDDVDVQSKVISVQIPRVSEQHLGRYVCQMMSKNLQGTVQPEFCTLRFNNETAPTAPTEDSDEQIPSKENTAQTVIIVILGIIVVIESGYLVFLYRRGHLPCKKGRCLGLKSAEEGERMETPPGIPAQPGSSAGDRVQDTIPAVVIPEGTVNKTKEEQADLPGILGSGCRSSAGDRVQDTIPAVVIPEGTANKRTEEQADLPGILGSGCRDSLQNISPSAGITKNIMTKGKEEPTNRLSGTERHEHSDGVQNTSSLPAITKIAGDEAIKQLAEHLHGHQERRSRGGRPEFTSLLNTTGDSSVLQNITQGRYLGLEAQPSEAKLIGLLTQLSKDKRLGLLTLLSKDKLLGLLTLLSKDKLLGLLIQLSEDKHLGLVTQASEDTSSDRETKPHQDITPCPSNGSETPADKNISTGWQTAFTPSGFEDAEDLGGRVRDTDDSSPAAKTGTNLSTNSADDIRQEETVPLLDDTENHTARVDEANEDSSVVPPAGKPISAAGVDVTLPEGSGDTDTTGESQMPASSPPNHGSDSDSENEPFIPADDGTARA